MCLIKMDSVLSKNNFTVILTDALCMPCANMKQKYQIFFELYPVLWWDVGIIGDNEFCATLEENGNYVMSKTRCICYTWKISFFAKQITFMACFQQSFSNGAGILTGGITWNNTSEFDHVHDIWTFLV